MESEGDGDGVGHRQRRERKEGRSYHDRDLGAEGALRAQIGVKIVGFSEISGSNWGEHSDSSMGLFMGPSVGWVQGQGEYWSSSSSA